MPWKKNNNPFDPPMPENNEPERKATMVEVKCLGCVGKNKTTFINFRVEKGDKGVSRKNCRECSNATITVKVDSKGGIVVMQAIGYQQPIETPYEKVWQEGDHA